MSLGVSTVPGPDPGADQNAQWRPRVLYVINSFDRGGAEAGLIALVRGGLFDDCRLTILGLVRGSGGLESRLRELGHDPGILLDRTRMRARDMPGLFRRLRHFVKGERPDVVIAALPQANLLARACVFFRRDVTFVSFEHNTHLAKWIYELGFRLTSMRVDWMFADAAGTLEKARERLYRRPPKKCTVLPLVRFDSPANHSALPTANRPFHIVNAARFTTTKNQAALIEAVALLNREQRDVKLTLYGDGDARQSCEALASRLGMASRIQFPGFVPDWSERPADLFVLASKHEGLCIVVLEAMHAGIPVVAPIIGGLRDYAAPGLVRALAAVDPKTIARAMSAAMDDRPGLAAQAAAAAKMVDQRFGAESVREVYADINRALIADARERERRTMRGLPLASHEKSIGADS